MILKTLRKSVLDSVLELLGCSEIVPGGISCRGQRRPQQQKIDRLRFESQVSNASS